MPLEVIDLALCVGRKTVRFADLALFLRISTKGLRLLRCSWVRLGGFLNFRWPFCRFSAGPIGVTVGREAHLRERGAIFGWKWHLGAFSRRETR